MIIYSQLIKSNTFIIFIAISIIVGDQSQNAFASEILSLESSDSSNANYDEVQYDSVMTTQESVFGEIDNLTMILIIVKRIHDNPDNCEPWEGLGIKEELLGTATEGQFCNKSIGILCKEFYKNETNCTKPTNLICEEGTNKCVKGMHPYQPKSIKILNELDEEGCFLRYTASSLVPAKLKGSVHYNEKCDPAGLTQYDRCKWYTQIRRTADAKSNSCLKPTHLYCHPILKICLCGRGLDEMQFQNEKESQKCYIRPTYDFVNGYECTKGSKPTKIRFANTTYKICECMPFIIGTKHYPPYFNTKIKNWWKCGATSNLPKGSVEFTLLIIVLLSNWYFTL